MTDTPDDWTHEDFRAWRARQGFSLSGAAAALGLSRQMIQMMQRPPDAPGHRRVSRPVQYLAQAIEAGHRTPGMAGPPATPLKR